MRRGLETEASRGSVSVGESFNWRKLGRRRRFVQTSKEKYLRGSVSRTSPN